MFSFLKKRKPGVLKAPFSWSSGEAPDQKAKQDLEEFRAKSLPKVTALTAINQRCIDMQKQGIQPVKILLSPEDSRELAYQSAVQTYHLDAPMPTTFDEPKIATYVVTLDVINQQNTYRSFIESQTGIRFDVKITQTDPATRRAVLREIDERERELADLRRQMELAAEAAAQKILNGSS